jgi:AraC-like DNA-binding protein
MSDAIDLHDLTTRIVSSPGIVVTVFLAGRAGISLGKRHHEVGARPAGKGRMTPMVIAYSMTERDVFERRGIRDQHVRKVGIRIPLGWLGEAGLDGTAGRLAARLETDHGTLLALPASQELVRLATVMLSEAGGGTACHGLMQEARAFEMVAKVFQMATAGEAMAPPPTSWRADLRIRAAQEYMAAHLDEQITLADVASHACVSISTLQRLFRDRLGMPVWDYLRRFRLEDARRFLERGEGSVTEAALRAGYTSPANFATAFKREYGMSPRRCRQ